MANIEINDLTEKTAPVLTDELEIQETGGGTSKKVTLANLFGALVHARARSTSAGTLQTGEVGVASVNKAATGIYDYTLDNAVAATATTQVWAGGETAGCEVSASMTSTTVCRVRTKVAGTDTDMAHSVLILKAG